MAHNDQILDSYRRAGVPLPGLRRACVTGGGLPVWVVHPLPPKRESFASWRRLRAAHDQTGLWPFLAGMDLKEVNRQAVSELWYDAATAHDPTALARGGGQISRGRLGALLRARAVAGRRPPPPRDRAARALGPAGVVGYAVGRLFRRSITGAKAFMYGSCTVM